MSPSDLISYFRTKMGIERELIAVGYDKNGEVDFGVNCSVINLDYKQMNEIRAMLIVAIGTMEDMWRREQQSKNPAQMEG